jgi:hypothetical protein
VSEKVEQVGHRVIDPWPESGSAGEIDAIVAAEREIRALQARQLERIARYAIGSAGGYEGREFGEFADDELALALNITCGAAARLLHLAVAASFRLPNVLDRMQDGDLDLRCVQVLDEVTAPLDGPTRQQVETYVLARADGKNASQLRQVANRAVARFDPAGVEDRHRARKKERRVEFYPAEDGMAELRAYLTAPDATLIKLRVDAYAKAQPPEDARTMDQRRVDALRDLLLSRAAGPIKTMVHVTIPANILADTTDKARAAHDRSDGETPNDQAELARLAQSLSATAASPTMACATRTTATAACATRTTAMAGSAIPTTTPAGSGTVAGGGGGVQVDRTGTAGWWVAGPQAAELAGHGTITAGQARELAASGDVTWRRLLTDPLSGTVLDCGRSTYAPPAGLADFVRARDRHCVFPGCIRPAAGCDLDHRVPFPKGPTSAANLAPLCRHHHRLKHAPGWRLDRRASGDYVWTSPAEIEYLSRPEPVVDPDPQPELDFDPDTDLFDDDGDEEPPPF